MKDIIDLAIAIASLLSIALNERARYHPTKKDAPLSSRRRYVLQMLTGVLTAFAFFLLVQSALSSEPPTRLSVISTTLLVVVLVIGVFALVAYAPPREPKS